VPTTTSTAPPAGPCGAQVKKADGTLWQCTWVDDFNGTALDPTKWIAQQTANSSFTSGVECNMDSPNNVSVADGVLSLTARKEAEPFTCTDPNGDFTTQYTAGSVSTYQRFSQAYGRFEVRAKFPAATVKGLQSAIWLWPDNATKYGAWPTSGEIDIAEAYSLHADRVIPYIHYTPWGGDAKATNNYCMISDISQFHTYVAEWTTKTISIIYDGTVCTIDNWNPALPLFKPQPFDQPFMVALTQALGLAPNGFDPAVTPLPATTQVDYVRVWK
jgi:beta-glucanase (GH16 family)